MTNDILYTKYRWSSMEKTTALPAMLLANWIAMKKVTDVGVIPIEKVIINENFNPFIEELKELGIEISFREEVLV